MRDNQEIIVILEQVAVGDILLVRPGEKIPTDGVVIEGLATIDESMVTGESLPVIKEVGHHLVGGCINANGVLKMRVTAVGSDTVLANIIHMVDQAQNESNEISEKIVYLKSTAMRLSKITNYRLAV